MNNLEIAHELVKNKKENFIALGTVIKNELKLTEENSFEVLSNVLKKQNKVIANQGGTIAGNTRKEIEAKIGKKVVSNTSAKKLLETKNKKLK